MKVITIDKSEFLKGFSTSKYVDDGGYMPISSGFEVDRDNSNFGLLNPGRSLTDTSTNLVDNIYTSVIHYNTDPLYYSIGSSGTIYSTNLSTGAHTVKHTELNNDYDNKSSMLVYDGALFVAGQEDIYNDNLTFTVNDYDWLTVTQGQTAMNLNYNHKLFEFNGYMYWTDGNKLGEYNGTTANGSRLTLPTGWIITDAVVDNDRIYLTASFASDNYAYNTVSKIFVWDGYSNSWIREVNAGSNTLQTINKVGNSFVVIGSDSIYLFDGYNLVKTKYNGTVGLNFNKVKVNGDKLYFVDSNNIRCYNAKYDCLTEPIKGSGTVNHINIGYLDYIDLFATTNKMYRASSNTGIFSIYSNWYDLTTPHYIDKIEIYFKDVLVTNAYYTVKVFSENEADYHQQIISYSSDGAIVKKVYKVDMLTSMFYLSLASSNTANKAIKAIKIYARPSEQYNNK